jgi:hypothetical protein
MAETAIGIAAPQDPLGGLVHRLADGLRIAAKLAQDEDGVEAGVDVPIRFLDVSIDLSSCGSFQPIVLASTAA